MNKIKAYSVVNFHKENKVAAVCSSWLNKEKTSCYWPSGPNSCEKLLNNLPPETDWQKFPCKWLMSYSKFHICNRILQYQIP